MAILDTNKSSAMMCAQWLRSVFEDPDMISPAIRFYARRYLADAGVRAELTDKELVEMTLWVS